MKVTKKINPLPTIPEDGCFAQVKLKTTESKSPQEIERIMNEIYENISNEPTRSPKAQNANCFSSLCKCFFK